jgi:diguanylate cyclase (GGDEF)-like protein/PAS domain S-box-containing protein
VRDPSRDRWIAVTAAVLLAYLVLDVAVQLVLAGDPAARAGAAALLMLPRDLLVVGIWLVAARVTRLDRRTSLAWLGLALAMTLMFAGDLAWAATLDGSGSLPFPSAADALYLVCVALVAGSLAMFRTRVSTRSERMRFLLDAAIVMVAGMMVAWQLAASGTRMDADPAATVLAAGYLVADMVLLFGLASVALQRHEGADHRALETLAGGLVIFLLADLVFFEEGAGAVSPAGWSDLLFTAATTVFGVAGLFAIRDASRPVTGPVPDRSRWLVVLPYTALLIGWTMLIGVAWSGADDDVLITLAGVLTLLVVGRQLMVVRENQRLIAAEARRTSEDRFRALVQHATDLITVLGPDGLVRFQTPSLAALLGYPPDALEDSPLADLVHPDDLDTFETLLATARAGAAATPREIRLRHRDGTWVPTETGVDDLSDEPAVAGLVLTSRDIRERKVLEARLVHQALHDPLTGLPNRTLFRDRVQEEMYRSVRERTGLWVMFLDVDDFKGVNDRYGHEVGDMLLVTFAERLSAAVRSTDMPARLGGDEFAIVMAGMPDVTVVTARADRLLDTLSRPYVVAGTELRVTVSMGIAQARPRELDAQGILRDADAAMYAAKAAGRARWELAGDARSPVPPSWEATEELGIL